jgi:hypothetical protein
VYHRTRNKAICRDENDLSCTEWQKEGTADNAFSSAQAAFEEDRGEIRYAREATGKPVLVASTR